MNLTAVNDNVTPANSVALTYSPANRLATANGAWGNTSFSYDGVGHRLTDVNTVGAVTTTGLAAYNTASNRITGMTENSAVLRNYTHDAAGNIITDTRPGEVFAFTFNARNRPAPSPAIQWPTPLVATTPLSSSTPGQLRRRA